MIRFLIGLMFALSSLVCLIGLVKTYYWENTEFRSATRYLLLTSSIWSFVETLQVFAENKFVMEALYTTGLVFGLLSVGFWLYFASAFSGSRYHNLNRVKYLTWGSILFIILVKITNPVHNLYITTSMSDVPFNHIVITSGIAHYFVVVCSYILCIFGFLIIIFGGRKSTRIDTKFIVLISLVFVPGIFSIVTYTPLLENYVPTFAYDSVGVSILTVGLVLFADAKISEDERLRYNRLIDNIENPIVIVSSEDNRILRYNQTFSDKFNLNCKKSDILSTSLEDIVEIKNGTVRNDNRRFDIFELDLDNKYGEDRKAIIFKDITEIHTKNTIIENQNMQFEKIAETISHEVRNGVQIINGHLYIVNNNSDPDKVDESMETIYDTVERIDRIADDLKAIARASAGGMSQSENRFSDIMEKSVSDVEDINVDYEGSGVIRCNTRKFDLMIEKCIQFAVGNGAESIKFSYEGDLLRVESDGNRYPPDIEKRSFDYGDASPTAELGSILPVVKAVASSQNWTISMTAEESEIFSYKIEGISELPSE
jgi:signal transduction histidine kinase